MKELLLCPSDAYHSPEDLTPPGFSALATNKKGQGK